jgi:glutamate racemase
MNYSFKNNSNPVCVFDSGIGGLNILYECCIRGVNENLLYFADNKNVPYGNLPPQKIRRLVLEIFGKIAIYNPKACVVACNTATAECIDILRNKYTFPIIGVQPAIKPAVKLGGKILVLATKATCSSKNFNALLSEYRQADIIVAPCDDLANFIEQNIFTLPEVLPNGLLPNIKVDSVVLGCTHYAYVKKHIQKFYSCNIFDGIVGTIDHLNKILGNDDHSHNKIVFTNFILGNTPKNVAIFSKICHNNFVN